MLAAGQQDTPQSTAALEELCRTYWYPVYAYVRRRGYGPEDAQDLTQEFFARFLARNYIATVDPRRGRFRSYLLGAVGHFLADEWDYTHRLKRGGGVCHVPFDAASGEARYALEPVDQRSPDRIFEQRWARALLDLVWSQLRREYELAGKKRIFMQLSVFLNDELEGQDYKAAAEALQMKEGATRVAACRLRQRYGELYRQAVADTVQNLEEIPDEMQHLVEVLSS